MTILESLQCAFIVSDRAILGKFVAESLLGLRLRRFLHGSLVLKGFHLLIVTFLLIVLSNWIAGRIVSIFIAFIEKLSFDIFEVFSRIILVVLVDAGLWGTF